MRWSAAVTGFVAVALAGAPAARAGVLGKVVNGMKQKSGQTDRGGGVAGDGDGDSKPHRSDSSYDDSYSTCGGCGDDPTAPLVVQGYHPAYPYGHGTEHFGIYLGLQSVTESDHAAAVSLLATSGDYGAQFSNTSYFERVPQPGGGDDTLRLDVWDVTLQYRLASAGEREQTQLWISGGFAGANSDGLEIYGASFGARFTQNLGGELGAEASVRNLRYQDDISGIESRVGVAASVVRLSYRYLKFNVGPPLKGPEFGIALQF